MVRGFRGPPLCMADPPAEGVVGGLPEGRTVGHGPLDVGVGRESLVSSWVWALIRVRQGVGPLLVFLPGSLWFWAFWRQYGSLGSFDRVVLPSSLVPWSGVSGLLVI